MTTQPSPNCYRCHALGRTKIDGSRPQCKPVDTPPAAVARGLAWFRCELCGHVAEIETDDNFQLGRRRDVQPAKVRTPQPAETQSVLFHNAGLPGQLGLFEKDGLP